jgi:hypothetical protein
VTPGTADLIATMLRHLKQRQWETTPAGDLLCRSCLHFRHRGRSDDQAHHPQCGYFRTILDAEEWLEANNPEASS